MSWFRWVLCAVAFALVPSSWAQSPPLGIWWISSTHCGDPYPSLGYCVGGSPEAAADDQLAKATANNNNPAYGTPTGCSYARVGSATVGATGSNTRTATVPWQATPPECGNGVHTLTYTCATGQIVSDGGICSAPDDSACAGVGPETTRVTIYGGRLNDLYGTDADIKNVLKRVREAAVNVDGCQYVYDPSVTDPDMKCAYGTEGIVDLRVYCELTLKRKDTGTGDGDIVPSDKSEPVCPANTDAGTVNGVPRCLPRSGTAPAPLPVKSTSSVEKVDNGDGTYTETITTVAPGGVITIDRVTRDSTTGEVKSGEQTASFQEGTGAGAAESVYSDAEGAGGGIENNTAPIQSHDMGSVFSGALGKSRWWDSSCLEDDSIEVYGQTVLLPWSAMCTPLDVLGRALVVLTLLWGVSFVIKGLK